jgi:hypothetical protein
MALSSLISFRSENITQVIFNKLIKTDCAQVSISSTFYVQITLMKLATECSLSYYVSKKPSIFRNTNTKQISTNNILS